MEIWQVVSSIILGLLSILLLTYSFLASKERGPILSNTYLFASAKEREKIDKAAEYHQVTVIFGILGMAFLLLTLQILNSWSWINYVIGILIVLVIIYAIVMSIKTERKNK